MLNTVIIIVKMSDSPLSDVPTNLDCYDAHDEPSIPPIFTPFQQSDPIPVRLQPPSQMLPHTLKQTKTAPSSQSSSASSFFEPRRLAIHAPRFTTNPAKYRELVLSFIVRQISHIPQKSAHISHIPYFFWSLSHIP
jgi:hypothetical protein